MSEVPVEEPVDADSDLDTESDFESDDETSDDELASQAADVRDALGDTLAEEEVLEVVDLGNSIRQVGEATELQVLGGRALEAAQQHDVPLADPAGGEVRYNVRRVLQRLGYYDSAARRRQINIAGGILVLGLFAGVGVIAWRAYVALTRGQIKPDGPYAKRAQDARRVDATWRATPDDRFYAHIAGVVRARGLHLPMQGVVASQLAIAFPERQAPVYADGQVRALVRGLSDTVDELRRVRPDATVFDALVAAPPAATTVDGATLVLPRAQACTIAQLAVLYRARPEAFDD